MLLEGGGCAEDLSDDLRQDQATHQWVARQQAAGVGQSPIDQDAGTGRVIKVYSPQFFSKFGRDQVDQRFPVGLNALSGSNAVYFSQQFLALVDHLEPEGDFRVIREFWQLNRPDGGLLLNLADRAQLLPVVRPGADPPCLDDDVGGPPIVLGVTAVVGQVEFLDYTAIMAVLAALDIDVNLRQRDSNPVGVVELSADAGHAVTVSRRSSRSRLVSKPVTRNS